MRVSLFTFLGAIILLSTACSSNHEVKFLDAENTTQQESLEDSTIEASIVESESSITLLETPITPKHSKISRRKNNVQSTAAHALFSSKSDLSTEETDEKYPVENHPLLVKETYLELGVTSPDADLNFISPNEIAGKFEDFVNAVDKNKKEYTVQDWTKVNVIWDSLVNRNKEIKRLKLKDRLKISSQRTRYSLMKSYRKTAAKISEK